METLKLLFQIQAASTAAMFAVSALSMLVGFVPADGAMFNLSLISFGYSVVFWFISENIQL